MLLYIALFVLLCIVLRKKIFKQVFRYTFVVFEKNPKIGKMLGVKYYDSDTWTTSRKESGLHIFRVPFAEKITGFNLRLGDIDFIKSFRNRQRNPISPFTIELPPGRRSFRELEAELIQVWHYQLKNCYEIPISDDDNLIESMTMMRGRIEADKALLPFMRTYNVLMDTHGIAKKRRAGFSGCSDEEKTLYLIPFLTTLDTFMLSLAYGTEGSELKHYFEKVPVKYVPMYEGDNVAIVSLKNNGQNNPGNSVFGPKGVVCPGSNVTTDILKAMRDFAEKNEWEVEGEPIQLSKMIAGLANMDDLYITIK